MYGFLPTQHLLVPRVLATFDDKANFLGTNFDGILCIAFMDIVKRSLCLLCKPFKSWRNNDVVFPAFFKSRSFEWYLVSELYNKNKNGLYMSSYLPESVIRTSLITNIHTVGLGYNKSMAFSWISLRLSVYIPSSAPTSICWLWVSGCIHEAVQLIRNGQPLNTCNKMEVYKRMAAINIYSTQIHWQLYN